MYTSKSNIESLLNKEIANLIKHNNTGLYNLEIKHNVTYSEFLSNKMLIIQVIRKGIPYSLFDLIRFNTPFNENDWAKFLDISTKSLQRYKVTADHHFKPIHSEKIIEMAEVTQAGLDVFGNIEKFRLWLNTPNYALGNIPPIELLNDSYGKDLVMTELLHISHGILI